MARLILGGHLGDPVKACLIWLDVIVCNNKRQNIKCMSHCLPITIIMFKNKVAHMVSWRITALCNCLYCMYCSCDQKFAYTCHCGKHNKNVSVMFQNTDFQNIHFSSITVHFN